MLGFPRDDAATPLMTRFPLHFPTLLLPVLAACSPPPHPEPAPAAPPAESSEVPVRTSVTDLPPFEAFIETRPTPEALRERYPGLVVVLPGEISTRELRMDNSRYFAELDEQGRVSGGRFQ